VCGEAHDTSDLDVSVLHQDTDMQDMGAPGGRLVVQQDACVASG
jgi:hypothetical protein